MSDTPHPELVEDAARLADENDELRAENERLRRALREVLVDQAWVDRYFGFPAKKMLNSVRVSTYEQWLALLDPEDGGESPGRRRGEAASTGPPLRAVDTPDGERDG